MADAYSTCVARSRSLALSAGDPKVSDNVGQALGNAQVKVNAVTSRVK